MTLYSTPGPCSVWGVLVISAVDGEVPRPAPLVAWGAMTLLTLPLWLTMPPLSALPGALAPFALAAKTVGACAIGDHNALRKEGHDRAPAYSKHRRPTYGSAGASWHLYSAPQDIVGVRITEQPKIGLGAIRKAAHTGSWT